MLCFTHLLPSGVFAVAGNTQLVSGIYDIAVLSSRFRIPTNCFICCAIERYLAITIIPKNKDAELMGAYLFFGQILAWLPPLVFTALNEAGVSIRISMLSLLLFWFISVTCLQIMGPYENALRQANESIEDSSPAANNAPQSVVESKSEQSSEAPS